jgi:hypothetical protein
MCRWYVLGTRTNQKERGISSSVVAYQHVRDGTVD